MPTSHDPTETIADFKSSVNMTSAELSAWLEDPDSLRVGFKTSKDSESVGHKSGRRIVELLQMKATDYSADDLQHMRKVIGYIRRHLAQRPQRDISETNWRYSLMNWGHDPLKLTQRVRAKPTRG